MIVGAKTCEHDPAWLEAIDAARPHLHFERDISREDETGEMFTDAVITTASAWTQRTRGS